ncbi:MAG: substrate-binding domain-containing protein [Desulfotomaculaceae bacterium]|nr:substrate-binding domain-containing protein [Desulfotomaculaceae bacterium]
MKSRAKYLVTAALLALLASLVLAGCSPAPQEEQNKEIILATTTSTQDSGLLDYILPKFEEKTGYTVKPIAVGTGAALAMGEKGEADVLLVHAPADEKKLVDSGAAINYQLVMHNDFIVIGPTADPANVKGSQAVDAFKKIATAKAIFVSRGDESGTHKKEKEIWKTAGITPEGDWYHQSGTGMGATINIANEKLGYTLSDRATYLAQKKNIKMEILSEGDKSLLNVYHVMQVNPDKFTKVNEAGGKALVEFMVAPDTQKLIEEFGKDKYGEPLFFPDAGKSEEDLGK